MNGAYMAGLRGIVLMQTSGFATLPNALASLAVPCQIPLLLMMSERGTLGDHQVGQAIVCRTMRPILEPLNIASTSQPSARTTWSSWWTG